MGPNSTTKEFYDFIVSQNTYFCNSFVSRIFMSIWENGTAWSLMSLYIDSCWMQTFKICYKTAHSSYIRHDGMYMLRKIFVVKLTGPQNWASAGWCTSPSCLSCLWVSWYCISKSLILEEDLLNGQLHHQIWYH